MEKTKQIEENAIIINKYLNSKLKGDPKKLYDAAGHLIVNGGKRLRPYMVIKSCQILKGKISNAMPAASAVEMVHNFTLVHDDIMDNDEMRHGVPTVHKKFGIPIAILAGDVLFSKAFQIVTDTKLSTSSTAQLVSRLAKACVDVCEGQLLDVEMAEKRKIPSQAEYITMIEKKTAALFDVSCAMGAICATTKISDISNLSSFGRNLGIAFQITDDLIGVMGDPKITKKPVGNDLREGKKSLPILMAIKLAKGNDKKIILKAFGNSKASKKDLNKAVDVIRSLGIEESVRKQALKYSCKAKKSLSKYSGSAKVELISLLDFVVKRSL
ncbi:MAG: polyprenyl synthetase family protein [Nitrosopumilus sp.]|nr:polyprenyl synthetase family protein [Nitrosopumilus sp.]MDH3489355.1 polyprenyl synthetase family protein [Nitrosopumilus sp.]MDH3516353.1 polyprenyl synthetase family protein [Nitrosopumilus sp.]MDH3564118.1 polyprenyl synthetase family protein [Nitrosopumilus sp.]MDH5553950.1 polyprenyl synthetase family protein [Nitrosopumilus sp.]